MRTLSPVALRGKGKDGVYSTGTIDMPLRVLHVYVYAYCLILLHKLLPPTLCGVRSGPLPLVSSSPGTPGPRGMAGES